MAARSAEGLERFEGKTAWPMLLLSLAVIPLLLLPLIVDLSPSAEEAIITVDWILWGLFAAEYLIRLYLAPVKSAFVRTNKIDLLVVVLPFLRPLRVARSARALRLLRAARLASLLGRTLDATRSVLTRHKLDHALLLTGIVVVVSAGLVEALERDAPDASITSFGDGLWWAITTVTTVGYGDVYPTTPAGRGVGVVLMILGIGVFGLLAGSLASYFVEQDENSHVDPQLDRIIEQLERIEATLDRSDSQSSRTNRPPDQLFGGSSRQQHM